MYLPPIGTIGVFTFQEPYNVDPYINRILKVVSIRSLEELTKDGVDPLNNIYIKFKMTKADYEDDLEESVPIIVFKSKAEALYYVPADRIDGLPKIDGTPYVRKIITLNLGALPTTINLSRLEEALKETSMEFIGIEPTSKITDGSNVELVDKIKHEQFMAALNNTPYAKRSKPYRMRYSELLTAYDELRTKYEALNSFMAKTWTNNVVNSNRPTQADLELYTKKCIIDVVAPVGAGKKAGFNSLVFYRRNSFNVDPKPAYMKGMCATISDSNSFTGLLDKTNAMFSLSKGSITNQSLPDIFSDVNHVEFDKDTTTSESRGSVEFVFEKPVNIMDMVLRPALDGNIACSKVRVRLYNKDDIMIYSVSFQLGTHYSTTESQGLTQYLKISGMQLSTNIPQTTPPELTP